MEFAKDLLATLRGRVSPVQSTGSAGGIEWNSLHTRLTAAHAAHGELARSNLRGALRDGGFTDWVLAGERRLNPSRAVNPADSTDSKGPQGMEDAVAGQLHCSGRGQ